MYVPHRGLWVPPGTAVPLDKEAAQRRAELAATRALAAVEREDEWARQVQEAEYRLAMAQVAEAIDTAERARQQRLEDAKAEERLADLYRAAKRQGTDARIQALIHGSAEKRARRINKVKSFALVIGLPVLVGFAAWSAAGVQAGFVKLLQLPEHGAEWWAAWIVEPSLIAVVASIIIARAVLRTSGGDTDWRATAAEWLSLATSVFLNTYGGWDKPGWSGFGHALTHSFAPLGAAGAAFLIGLFIDYATKAKPWEGAQRLDETGLALDDPVRNTAPATLPFAHPGYALPDAQDAQPDEPVTQPDTAQKTRKTGARPGRVKQPAQAPTSGYAPGEDPATRAALDVLSHKFDSQRAAAAHHAVSEGTVRNRIKALKADPAYAHRFPSLTHPQINGHPVTAGTDN